MFHKGARTAGGGLPAEISKQVEVVLDEFVDLVTKEVQRRGVRRGVVRSQLSCSMAVIRDREHVWVAAQKHLGMPTTLYLDFPNSVFPIQEVIAAAKWEFGFDDPFVIGFPCHILSKAPPEREAIIQALVNSHVESEMQKVNQQMNMIQINPIFGPASYRVDSRLVFVLMPFEERLTRIYLEFIKPTVELPQFHMICKRADDIKSNRVIIQDIWKSLCEARLVIADISGLNPNVMYELGVAHTLGKETILVYQRSDSEIKFPFDLAHIRRIEYEDSATGGKQLERDLKETIESLLSPKLLG